MCNAHSFAGLPTSPSACRVCLRNVCVCAVFSFILDVRLADVPAGVTQKEGHMEFLIHLSSAGACLIFSREKDSAVPFPRLPFSRIL